MEGILLWSVIIATIVIITCYARMKDGVVNIFIMLVALVIGASWDTQDRANDGMLSTPQSHEYASRGLNSQDNKCAPGGVQAIPHSASQTYGSNTPIDRLCQNDTRTIADLSTGSPYKNADKLTGATPRQNESMRHDMIFEFEPFEPGGFAPLYRENPQYNVASTNAGDYRLYVGGGSINAAFLRLLQKEQNLRCGGQSGNYAKLHHLLLSASGATGRLVSAMDIPNAKPLLGELRLAGAFGQSGRCVKGDCVGFEKCNASVFIDVFKADARPLNGKNVAMLYVVGPKGERCKGPKTKGSGPLLNKEDFLATVELLGRRALEAVHHYNNTRAPQSGTDHTQLPKIEEVRWCLVSGGVYRHTDATKDEIAKATLDGMMSAACTGLRVRFAYDEGEFLHAYEMHTIAQER